MIKLLTHNDNDLQSPVAKSRRKYERLLRERAAVWHACRRIGVPQMGLMQTQGLTQALILHNINRLLLSTPCANPVSGHLHGLAGKAEHNRGLVAGTAHAAVDQSPLHVNFRFSWVL